MSIQELSESAALAMAAKYFGFQTKSPASLVERKSDYAIDPVTPFDDMPDPDAPSKAEMMENFKREESVSPKNINFDFEFCSSSIACRGTRKMLHQAMLNTHSLHFTAFSYRLHLQCMKIGSHSKAGLGEKG